MQPGRISGFAGLVLCLVALSGCGTWFGAGEDPPLPGDRLAVLRYETDLKPDPRIAGQAVEFPPAYRNASWTQPGGGPLHAVGHVEGPTTLKKPVWKVDIGSGAGGYRPMLAEPVAIGNRIYTMDSKYRITAWDTEKGKRVWRIRLKVPSRDGEAFGGGISYDGGRLYVSTGYGAVVALNAEDGEIVWRAFVQVPVRSAPLVSDGLVYVVLLDNQLTALDAATGEKRWRHSGFSEPASLLGGATPAGLDGTVIVPYSSGEIFALRAANGRATWSDNLAAIRRVDAASALADINALPVTDGKLVYAISHSGRMVAVDLRTGARAWERAVGGVSTPWLAGDWLFVVNNEAQVVALSRREGRVRWVMQLERYEDPEDREDPIHWLGPLLVSGQLLMIGNHGEAVAISPESGEEIARFDVPGNATKVIVSDATLYLLTKNGSLRAYR